MTIRRVQLIAMATALFALAACEEKKDAGDGSKDEAKTEAADDKAAGDTKEAKAEDKAEEKADAPDCSTVVDQIASLNPESGDAERKLWNKMCDEMTPEQRTCVASMKEMEGMKDCMGAKGEEKLE